MNLVAKIDQWALRSPENMGKLAVCLLAYSRDRLWGDGVQYTTLPATDEHPYETPVTEVSDAEWQKFLDHFGLDVTLPVRPPEEVLDGDFEPE